MELLRQESLAEEFRAFFVSFECARLWPVSSLTGGLKHYSYSFKISRWRYSWIITKRFSEVKYLDSLLYSNHQHKMQYIKRPRFVLDLFRRFHRADKIQQRGEEVKIYLQMILDDYELAYTQEVLEFIGFGAVSHSKMILEPFIFFFRHHSFLILEGKVLQAMS
jgi:hypothetical protein